MHREPRVEHLGIALPLWRAVVKQNDTTRECHRPGGPSDDGSSTREGGDVEQPHARQQHRDVATGDGERRTTVEQSLQFRAVVRDHRPLAEPPDTVELLVQAAQPRDVVPIEGPHKDDLFLIEKLAEQGQRYGFEGSDTFTPDRWLVEGDSIEFGEQKLEVLHCPGHTPGHLVFFHREARFAIVGDVLFNGSIGRTDLPRGNHEQLIHSIREKLFPIGDDIRFVPGHGPDSTFGQERISNPFVADKQYG